jgi:hypothetical protein
MPSVSGLRVGVLPQFGMTFGCQIVVARQAIAAVVWPFGHQCERGVERSCVLVTIHHPVDAEFGLFIAMCFAPDFDRCALFV